MNQLKFSDLGLADPIQLALKTRNHDTPTPIQQEAIPELLKGSDVLGIAQTGTGKTGAFALPILHKLSKNQPKDKRREPRALILAPTRELAIQIGEEIAAYGQNLQLRHTVIFGGVKQNPQVNALRRGIDIIVATPGRLLDLMSQGFIDLNGCAFLVLDEADRMLDMGFVHDVRKIVSALPNKRQSLLFSATMPKEIARLSGDMLNNPVRIEVTPQATPIESITQNIYHVGAADKTKLLSSIMDDPSLSKVIVFTRTKHRANRVADKLGKSGVDAEAIHGNKSQGARQRALSRFRAGEARVLVATDIAARGIDVDGVTHVINFELPNEPESYVHRIGRTARAGAGGAAVSFCDPGERAYLRDIERLIQKSLTVIGDGPEAIGPETAPEKQGGNGRRNGQRNGQRKPSGGAGFKRGKRRGGRGRKQSAGGHAAHA
ncbi:MAG: DEAD/DEAH box helicase [Rhodospirillaceae bacterium]|nr:DEAD/DEAH box helicase [Rhodospirillaceae bacterium]MBT3884575.1 DEAD/DEAH box helicase [Rhodospirillaceae bacterium]MBT4119043.1 DEAD/DEAH box helicase [Rhodospirillaceae bacterium]MBT4674756.1 DEAD/DEAH box helicase [Rhodospirillaceae bacterium]MBT4749544.1 DEAD/DEAH box helicase [Rhodospirillaceae bacterium]